MLYGEEGFEFNKREKLLKGIKKNGGKVKVCVMPWQVLLIMYLKGSDCAPGIPEAWDQRCVRAVYLWEARRGAAGCCPPHGLASSL